MSDHDHGDGPATDPLADLDLHPLRGMAADTPITGARLYLMGLREAIDRAVAALEEVERMKHMEVPSPHTGNDDVDPSKHRQRRRRRRGFGGAAGVARVLQSRPGEGFTEAELAHALVANGWDLSGVENPAKAARAAANRLRRDEPDYVLDSGRFFYRPLVSVNHDARPDGMPRGHVSDHEPSGVPWPADDVRLREQRPAESVG